jgi:hypothetical protein
MPYNTHTTLLQYSNNTYAQLLQSSYNTLTYNSLTILLKYNTPYGDSKRKRFIACRLNFMNNSPWALRQTCSTDDSSSVALSTHTAAPLYRCCRSCLALPLVTPSWQISIFLSVCADSVIHSAAVVICLMLKWINCTFFYDIYSCICIINEDLFLPNENSRVSVFLCGFLDGSTGRKIPNFFPLQSLVLTALIFFFIWTSLRCQKDLLLRSYFAIVIRVARWKRFM